MYREVTGSDHSDGSGNLPVHSSVPGGYRCFSFAVKDVCGVDGDRKMVFGDTLIHDYVDRWQVKD